MIGLSSSSNTASPRSARYVGHRPPSASPAHVALPGASLVQPCVDPPGLMSSIKPGTRHRAPRAARRSAPGAAAAPDRPPTPGSGHRKPAGSCAMLSRTRCPLLDLSSWCGNSDHPRSAGAFSFHAPGRSLLHRWIRAELGGVNGETCGEVCSCTPVAGLLHASRGYFCYLTDGSCGRPTLKERVRSYSAAACRAWLLRHCLRWTPEPSGRGDYQRNC